MENNMTLFTEYLDNYLDEYEIERKKFLDREEEQCCGKYTTDSPFNIEDAITMDEFVNNYLEIRGNCLNLYHSGLRELESSYVIGVDNNYANRNPELVYQGYLLLVIDGRGCRGTYLNPYYLKNMIENKYIKQELKKCEQRSIHNFEDLPSLYEYHKEMLEVKETYDEFYKVVKGSKKIHKVKMLQQSKTLVKKKG